MRGRVRSLIALSRARLMNLSRALEREFEERRKDPRNGGSCLTGTMRNGVAQNSKSDGSDWVHIRGGRETEERTGIQAKATSHHDKKCQGHRNRGIK